jgi:hypothetical protein
VDATLTDALGAIGFNISGSSSDTVTGFGDLAPQFALRWNFSVNNFMTYVAGDIPLAGTIQIAMRICFAPCVEVSSFDKRFLLHS